MEFVEKDSLREADRFAKSGRNDIFLALGANMPSNAGAAHETLIAVLMALNANGLTLTAISRFFKTPAFPAGSGPDYVNACVKVNSPDTCDQILLTLHRIEADFGRVRGERWAARGCDIDLLAVGNYILPNRDLQARWRALPLEDQLVEAPDQLILPHPRMTERAFVLIPLLDIAPDFVDPVSGVGIAALLNALPEADKAEIRPF
jgi:2-amino-4-hydroxy-6-hydroxymethyldihydropteridine diphosphokinase